MKILNLINYMGGLGADRWIGEGFKDAYEDLGHEFYWLTYQDDLKSRLDEVRPDILMIGGSMLNKANVPILNEFRSRGMKVVVRIDSFFDKYPEILESVRDGDPADLYYGETEGNNMDHFMSITGKKYHVITNAAHQRLHKPTEPVDKYKCDIVFLGANLPLKKEIFGKILFPLMDRYDVKVYGPNWTTKDITLKAFGKVSRTLGMQKANRIIQDMRITVPIEDENKLYSSAKICINIHERTEAIKSHVILNERTFKIPACGGFEICDFVPPLRNYFTEDEMVMADDRNGDWVKDWFEKIDYYLKHDKERRAIKARGTERALRDHMYTNRVKEIINLLF